MEKPIAEILTMLSNARDAIEALDRRNTTLQHLAIDADVALRRVEKFIKNNRPEILNPD